MTTPSKLLSLPAKLLLNILVHLDDPAILLLRRVCRDLQSKSFNEFGDRFFCWLSVTHQEPSVAKLKKIANHLKLNTYVRNLTISGELSEEETQNLSKGCTDWHRDLGSVIPRFPNFELLTIDNLSSYKKKTCSCTFSGAINLFHDSRLSFELRLNLCISACNPSPNTHLFDIRTQLWKEGSAPKVSALKLVTGERGDNTWEANLLCSLLNLQYFNVEGKVPDWTWENLSWPMLNTMELRALSVPSQGFVTFIMSHSTTLSSVIWEDVTVHEGTWEESLQKVTRMKGLRYVRLVDLYQRNPSVEAPDSLKLNFSKMESEVVLNNRDEIGMGAEVIHYRLLTTPSTSNEFHLVDFRLVKAVVKGEIGYRQGQWKL